MKTLKNLVEELQENLWMQKAFGAHPGALHRQLKVPQGQKISAKKLGKATKKAKKIGDTRTLKRLALAKTAKKIASRRKR